MLRSSHISPRIRRSFLLALVGGSAMWGCFIETPPPPASRFVCEGSADCDVAEGEICARQREPVEPLLALLQISRRKLRPFCRVEPELDRRRALGHDDNRRDAVGSDLHVAERGARESGR